jgi:hypothetical protein
MTVEQAIKSLRETSGTYQTMSKATQVGNGPEVQISAAAAERVAQILSAIADDLEKANSN